MPRGSSEQPLADRIALVTGGGGGIGSAICQALAQSGARVVITYRADAAAAEQTRAGLPGSGHIVLQASVTDSEAMAGVRESVESHYGGLDILVNNAGITRPVPHADLDQLDDELIDDIFRTNWRGAFASIRALRSLLAASDDGLVVNLSSVAATTGIGSNVAYCASKAALDSMTRSLARALAPAIRVVSVAPGWVLGKYARQADPAYLAAQVEATPLGRLASADDVAAAVIATATQLRFTTGSIIAVDGGRPLGSGK